MNVGDGGAEKGTGWQGAAGWARSINYCTVCTVAPIWRKILSCLVLSTRPVGIERPVRLSRAGAGGQDWWIVVPPWAQTDQPRRGAAEGEGEGRGEQRAGVDSNRQRERERDCSRSASWLALSRMTCLRRTEENSTRQPLLPRCALPPSQPPLGTTISGAGGGGTGCHGVL